MSLTETFGRRNGHIESLILATISHISPENPVIKLFRCYSAHPVSILRLTGFEELFQSAPKSRSMDHKVKHRKKIKSYSQAFNLKKRLKRASRKYQNGFKIDINRNGFGKEDGSHLATVLQERL